MVLQMKKRLPGNCSKVLITLIMKSFAGLVLKNTGNYGIPGSSKDVDCTNWNELH